MATARFCPACGKPVDPTAAFCPACGRAMPPAGSAPVYYPQPPIAYGMALPYTSAAGPLPASQYGPADAKSMRHILWASILGLVASLSGVLPYALGYNLAGLATRNTSTIPPAGLIDATIGLLVAALVFFCIEYWLFHEGFHTLAATDRGLQSPSTLSLLAIAGAALAVGSLAWLVAQLYAVAVCANGVNPVPSSCVHAGLLVGAAGLLFLGAIIALVGLIGVWLGLWRLGTRYDESLFKIGMILSIFPFIDIAGFILLIVAARKVAAKASAPRPPGLMP